MLDLHPFEILARYVAALGVIFVGLSILTIRSRRHAGIALGTGTNDELLRRTRAHANFAEYAPLALILIAGAAAAGAPVWFVHATGAALVAGRLLHAVAIYRSAIPLRVAGMALTLTTMLAACGAILIV